VRVVWAGVASSGSNSSSNSSSNNSSRRGRRRGYSALTTNQTLVGRRGRDWAWLARTGCGGACRDGTALGRHGASSSSTSSSTSTSSLCDPLPLPLPATPARCPCLWLVSCPVPGSRRCRLHAACCIPSSYAGYAVSIGAPVTAAWQRLLPAGHTLALPNSLAASSARREPRHWAAQRSSRMPTAIAGRTRAAQAPCVQVSKRSKIRPLRTPKQLRGHSKANPMPLQGQSHATANAANACRSKVTPAQPYRLLLPRPRLTAPRPAAFKKWDGCGCGG
jgi:hypothetical protein